MKLLGAILLMGLVSCGGGSGEGSCNTQSGINGAYRDVGNRLIQTSGCNFYFEDPNTTCMITGTYTGGGSTIAVNVGDYTGACGSVPSSYVCNVTVNSSSSFAISCPATGLAGNYSK